LVPHIPGVEAHKRIKIHLKVLKDDFELAFLPQN
jgi:hypothetical protein